MLLVHGKLTGTGQAPHCSGAARCPPPAILGSSGQPCAARVLREEVVFSFPVNMCPLTQDLPRALCASLGSLAAVKLVTQHGKGPAGGWDSSLFLLKLPQNL